MAKARRHLHSVYVIKPKIGPESLAEKLIAMGNVEEVKISEHNIGYLVKVRFMFMEPDNIEKYIYNGVKKAAVAVVAAGSK